jgi:hypothetical protein
MIIWIIIGILVIGWLAWHFYRKDSIIRNESDRDKAVRLVLQTMPRSKGGGAYTVESAMPYSVDAPNTWNIRLRHGAEIVSATVDLEDETVSDISRLV